MNFLHPVFTILTIVLILFSFSEVNTGKKYPALWIVIIIMMVLIGLRDWVGADYGAYRNMYEFYGDLYSYTNIINKENVNEEWLFVLLGKFVYDMGYPFYIFTFVVAIIALGFKFQVFHTYSIFPALSILLYIFPSYFSAEGGHMRQAIAMSIAMFSFYFIKKRRLLPFLFCIYIAIGFHNSAFVFIIAYWMVLFPLNSKRIGFLVVTSMILAPFKVYENISILESIAPNDVYSSYTAYSGMEYTGGGAFIKLTDVICMMYLYFLTRYDKVACRNIMYYEYMRNLGVVAICLYFIFRESPIYSSRLVSYYMMAFTLILPNIVGAIQEIRKKQIYHLGLIVFVVFYYFVYATMQASRAGYTWDRYNNILFW